MSTVVITRVKALIEHRIDTATTSANRDCDFLGDINWISYRYNDSIYQQSVQYTRDINRLFHGHSIGACWSSLELYYRR